MAARTNAYEKESLPNEYAHSFHAGNVGDVWKHVVLLTVLSELAQSSAPLRVIDCYAGAGGYRLPGTGEWTEGIGALIKNRPAIADSAISRYLEIVAPRFSPARFYPGSPLLIEALLREQDVFTCHETNAEARKELTAHVAAKTQVFESDGLDGLRDGARQAASSQTPFFALIDPPWVKKEDWQSVPRALVETWTIYPRACLLLWYPIKSYTRVNAMVKNFQEAGLPAVALDLITTPLENQRNRLNGSGLILVNGIPAMIAEASKAATLLGRACATHKSYWSLRISELQR